MNRIRTDWVEVALCVIGLGCVVAYATANVQAARAQANAMASLESDWQVAATALPDTSQWSAQRVERYTQSGADAMPPLGLLTISAVGVRVAVFNGTSAEVLNRGVGRVPGTAAVSGEGNLAIAGHRDGFFRGLKDIEVGDDIAMQHANGTNQYRVTSVSIVEPTDVSVLASTEVPAITLITCYPFYYVGSAPQRFIVRGELTDDETAS